MEMIRNNRIGVKKPSPTHPLLYVLTFDPQPKKILAFSVKDRYQLNYFICIKDFNAETITSLKLNLFSLWK
jgi:hypothetical protein